MGRRQRVLGGVRWASAVRATWDREASQVHRALDARARSTELHWAVALDASASQVHRAAGGRRRDARKASVLVLDGGNTCWAATRRVLGVVGRGHGRR